MNETSTPRIVTLCAPRRPIVLPNRPATTAPVSGATGAATRRLGESSAAAMRASTLQGVELVDVDRGAIAEQHHQDRQPDRRLGCSDGQDEEHEHLPGHVAEVV